MRENRLLIITMRKNNTFYSINKNMKIPKKLTHTGQKAWENVGFVAVFRDIT